MISRIRSSPYLKLLSMLNSAPSAAFARAKRPPHPAQEKVGLKLTWPMTYSRTLAPRCMSPNCSHAFTPLLASPSIAKASSLPSPRKSPARTASSAPTRTPSACDRRPDDLARRRALYRGPGRDPSPCDPSPDDLAGSFPGYRRRLAVGLPPIAHLPTCCAASPGLAGVFGTTVPVTHHLGQRGPESQLERRVFSAFSLRLAAPGVVSSHPPARPGLLPGTVGGRGRR